MTFSMLNKIIKDNDIPDSVRLMSDSGWECDATDMCGVFYNKSKNIMIFVQEEESYGDADDYSVLDGWEFIYPKNEVSV